jgi:hypothetical protein
MRFIQDLCTPAFLYLVFLVVHLGLDMGLGLWVTATVKLILGIATVFLLDAFCGTGLGVLSWVLVATPFVVTSLATAIAMGMNLDGQILGSMRETFYDKKAKTNELPDDSNALTQLTE